MRFAAIEPARTPCTASLSHRLQHRHRHVGISAARRVGYNGYLQVHKSDELATVWSMGFRSPLRTRRSR